MRPRLNSYAMRALCVLSACSLHVYVAQTHLGQDEALNGADEANLHPFQSLPNLSQDHSTVMPPLHD